MDEFLGLTIIVISVLGLVYSIGEIVIGLTRKLPVTHSLDNMLAFHKGMMLKLQSKPEVEQ